MKKTLHFFMLITIYLICGARGCDNDHSRPNADMDPISASRDSILKMIEFDIPDAENLKSHEQNAIQKLIDFTDYMKVITDTKIELQFRQQASDMARKLFVSNQIVIQNWDYLNENSKNDTLNQFINNRLQEGTLYWIEPEAIKIEKSLSQKNDSSFRGQLSINKKRFPFGKQLLLEKFTDKNLVDFYLLRRGKTFGKENIKVWEVLLGDIN
jgi:hypothetical protein